ncbi:MAG: 23S rRNA (adenine(2503)-C(2))-methyltransferase RlmN [endosymbiont of Galathealinum brachiosum]|uniref:Dual-specificity RNA methyltransferase RlmN n=1 Tax=endosymbiont of Galathealinum brachiosum TaxID=2200906 RepID=A0A370DHV2_9GAMM|nr:MAG: 23S rRNA (adenine(2503)-C(2))-methyltransferase RlmN [endosymbiont of Galathealinum brachiosum]
MGLNRQDMGEFFEKLGEKPFRVSQVTKWIHQLNVSDFDQMTNLSKKLREQLKEKACIKSLDIIEDQISTDGTRKWALGLEDNNRIEVVYIPEDDRGTLCISSQVGCALDCSFCSTARQGFSRNLTVAEILSQIWLATRLLDEEKKPGRKITNVVLMGMGEPLLNFDNVMKAIDVMLDDFAYGLSKRRVTVSTAGVVPAMDKLAERHDVQLAISLHATRDELRDDLVPINKKYNLEKLIPACQRFMEKRSPRSRLTIEYVMLAGVNDTKQDAEDLIKVLDGISVLINLIPFNPFPGSGYKTSSNNAVHRFQDVLMKAGLITVIRKTRGEDIDAACGQLVGKVEDKSRRENKFKVPRIGMNT